MYKDKSQQKEANRLASQRRRAKGMTEEVKTSYPEKENVIPSVIPWYPNKKTDSKGNPITPLTLSDGQLFYPEKKTAKYNKGRIGFIQKELNDPYLIEGIESAAKMFGDRDTRYERALRYKLWREGKGQVIDTGTLAKLSMIKDQLKLHGVLDGVLYGSSKLGDIL